jgi:alanyl-tRNA synthetase
VTERLYRADPYLLEFEAHVSGRAEHEGRPALLLDRTAFYAESGGQPWDTGTLRAGPHVFRVVAVVEGDGGVLHVLEAQAPVPTPLPEPGATVTGAVDALRRRDHLQQHHGQHLLSRAFVETARARTVSFHLGARECTVDLDREVSAAEVGAAVRRANEVIWEARPVEVRVVGRAEAAALGLAVPEEAGDEVRLVHAEGFDLQPCGGTHPRRTSEVGVVMALGQERHKTGSRVRFACGLRAVMLAEEHHGLLRAAGAALSTGPEGVPEAVTRTLEQLAESARHVRALQEQSIEGEAERLLAAAGAPASGAPRVITRVVEGWDAALLRLLATRLTERPGVVALLATRAATAQLVFARSEDVALDVGALLQETLAPLGGRGGGRGRVAQGGGPQVAGLEDALARAAESAGAARP